MRVLLLRSAKLHEVLGDDVAARLVFQAVVCDVALLFHPTVGDRRRALTPRVRVCCVVHGDVSASWIQTVRSQWRLLRFSIMSSGGRLCGDARQVHVFARFFQHVDRICRLWQSEASTAAASARRCSEDVYKVWQGLSPTSEKVTIAVAFSNVHGVYKPGNVKLQPELLAIFQKFASQDVSRRFFYLRFARLRLLLSVLGKLRSKPEPTSRNRILWTYFFRVIEIGLENLPLSVAESSFIA